MGRWWRYKWITFHPSLTMADRYHGVPAPCR
ncbi:transferase [Escherichia coli]|nr:transferase [Escherichia coli]